MYEFEVDQLDLMSKCLDAHGFAIIKDVLPDSLVESLKQAVLDGTDPETGIEARAKPHSTCLGRIGSGGLATLGI